MCLLQLALTFWSSQSITGVLRSPIGYLHSMMLVVYWEEQLEELYLSAVNRLYFTHIAFCLLIKYLCAYKYIDSLGSTREAISCCDSDAARSCGSAVYIPRPVNFICKMTIV